MKNNWKWMLGITLFMVILFFLPTLYHGLFGYAGFGPGMMSGYGWQRPMMGGFGRSYGMFSPFGGLFMGIGMLFGWLIQLGLLFLLVYGALALFNKTRSITPGNTPAVPPAVESHCSNCGEAVETGWKACPYCGEKL
jgi:hypothetical protein